MPMPRRKEIDGKIQCIACKEWKIYDDFHSRSENNGRPYSKCKKCHNFHTSKRLKENPPKWYETDAWAANKSAKDYGIKSTLPPLEWKEIVEKHNFLCYMCGIKLSIIPKLENTVTLDHILPLSRGGDNSKENVLPACWRCNNSKRDMTIGEFIQNAKKWSEIVL